MRRTAKDIYPWHRCNRCGTSMMWWEAGFAMCGACIRHCLRQVRHQ